MHRSVVAALVLSLAVPASQAAAAAGTDPVGTVSGTVHVASGRNAAHASVRLRDLTTGEVTATATADDSGAFTFVGVAPGTYTVELLDAAGAVVSSSGAVAVSTGAVTGVAVSGPAAAAATASFFASPVGLLSVAAAGAAVAGVTVAANRPTASPSR